MADSVTVADLPDGFDLYGAYVDGNYENYNEALARFGAAKVVPIAVFSTTNAGIVGDCENGDMTPATAVQWVVSRRNAGVDPTIYCSEAAWGAVRQAFQADHVAEPHYWIAGYPGSVGEALYPGSVAHQWIDRGYYDESVVADYWPGVDPVPDPAPPTEGEETDMVEYDGTDGFKHVIVYEPGKNRTVHYYQPPGGFKPDVNPTPWKAELMPEPA